VWDRPPVNLIATTTFRWRTPRPLGWEPVREVWGDLTYTPVVDGRPLGDTSRTSFPIEGRLRDGRHRWRLVVTDERGQRNSTPSRSLRIDGSGPRLSIRARGKHAAGKPLRLVVHAVDRHAGVRSVKVDFGDGSAPAFGTDLRHTFARGRYTLTVTGVDRVGNTRVVTRRLTVR
jgi:hypothetical protein